MRAINRSTLAVVGGVLVTALVTVVWPHTSSAASAAPVSPCAACQIGAARRFLQSPKVMDCREGTSAAEEARFRSKVQQCERRYGCPALDPDGTIAALREVVEAVEARICGPTPCTGDNCGSWGDPIDPNTVQGPVGLVPPAVDPAAAPSLDDVHRFCQRQRNYDAPPPLLALPVASALPEWCSEERAYGEMVETCGSPRVVVVAEGADPAVADGSAGRPFARITDAISACGQASCHILLGPGTYIESPQVNRCTFIEGGVRIDRGIATRGASRPRIAGAVGARGNAIVLARIDVRDDYGALSSDGDVLVSEAVLRGGYEGGSSAFGATGPRLCRTHIAAGYSGFDIAWHSSHLWLAGSAVSACYQGMALSWGSRGLKVLDSVVYGGYEAAGTSWGSVDVEVLGSRLGSANAAVDIHIAPDDHDVFPATFDVIVTGNRIASGTLPASDAALNIIVEDNIRE